MTDLPALLTRWNEHEPDRCHVGPPTGLICAEVFAVGTFHSVFWREPTGVQLLFVLAAVIEAAQARGWDWSLEGQQDPDGEHSYDATVWPSDDTEHRAVSTSAPAHAALGAYLAALQAEAIP